MIVREATPAEYEEVGELRIAAYIAGGFMSPQSGYAPVLAALGTDGDGQVLVAVDEGQILGTVMLQPVSPDEPPPPEQRWVSSADEAEIRALAVTPDGQGRGTGRALLQAVTDYAAQSGVKHLVLCTQPDMLAARHLYEQAGFTRLPERDWGASGITLLAYGRILPGQ